MTRVGQLTGMVLLPGLFLATCFHSTAHAKTLLRYKFKPGQQLNYLLRLDTTREFTYQSSKHKVEISQLLEFAAQTESCDKEGIATLKIKINRVRYLAKQSSADPNFKTLTFGYDTKNKEWIGQKPSAEQKEIINYLQGYDALAGKFFTVTVNDIGVIKGVKIPQALQKTLETLDMEWTGLQWLLAKENRELYLALSRLFQNPVPKGLSLVRRKECGIDYQFTTTYHGSVQKQQKTLEQIHHALKIIVPPYSQKAMVINLTEGITVKGPPVPILNKKVPQYINKQSFEGTVHFDNNAGQLVEIQASHTVHFPIFLKGPTPIPSESNMQYQLKLQP